MEIILVGIETWKQHFLLCLCLPHLHSHCSSISQDCLEHCTCRSIFKQLTFSFKKSTCSVMAHPAPPTPCYTLPWGREGRRFSLHWKTALCTLKYHHLRVWCHCNLQSQKQQLCPRGMEKDKFPASQKGSRYTGSLSPAVTESITAKILQGGWNNVVSDHYILYNVLVYLYNEPPAQRLKSKHFTEMKVTILHLSFSKTLKELYKAFGDVKDLYRVHR